jgi:hypothetical protein
MYNLSSIWGWIIVPVLFANNFFGGDQILGMPYAQPGAEWKAHMLNTPWIFNKTGARLFPVDLMNKSSPSYDLNMTAYKEQSPIYITTQFAGTHLNCGLTVEATNTHITK